MLDHIPMGVMVAKIVGFGDSFVYGNELSDNHDGHRAWPGLAASDLGYEYEARALAGCGNDRIAKQVYEYFGQHKTDNTLAVINWTWHMRWDFYFGEASQWITLGPTCVPAKLQHDIGLLQAQHTVNFYKEHIESNTLWNLFHNLQTIFACQQWMHCKGVRSVQTYIDPCLVNKTLGDRLDHYRSVKSPHWPVINIESDLQNLPADIQQEINHDYDKNILLPDYITELQTQCKREYDTFEGLTFLEWSRYHGFAVTDLLHPLEQAHQAAANYWVDRYATALGIERG